MAGRRIQFAIVGDTSRLRKAVDSADRTLGKFRGTALKMAAALALVNTVATLGGAAVALFAGALAALPVALAGIGLAGAAMDKRVQGAFKRLKTEATSTLKDIGKPLTGPLIDGAASLGRAFESVAPYLKQISREAAPLVSGFFSKVESFADKVGPKLPAMFRNALPVVSGFASLIGKVGAAVGRFFSGDLLNGDNLRTAFESAGDTIAGLLDRIRAIGDFLAPFVEQIATGLQPVIDAVVAAFDALLKKLQPVSDWFKEHPSIIQALATAIGIVVVALYAFSVVMAIVNAVMLLNPVTWIIIGIVALIAVIILCVKHWDKIKAAMGALWKWITSKFVAGWDWVKAKVLGAVAAMRAGNQKAVDKIRQLLGDMVAWFKGLPGRILGAIGKFNTLLVTKGRELIGGASSGILARWQGLREWVRGLAGRVVSAVGNTASKLKSAGRDLIGGMIAGVKEKAYQLISAVTGPISDAIGSAKSLLGINSPSRVFAQIGKFTIQGYADGVDRYARTARTAVQGALDPSGLQLSAIGAGGGGNVYEIHMPSLMIGVDMAAAGRAVVEAIEAFETAGGRRRAR